MTAYGFPTILQYSRLNSAITDLKSQSEEARVEIVTGQKANLKNALAGDIGDAQLLRKAINDIAVYQLSANRALGRATFAQAALEDAATDATALGADLSSALGFEDEARIAQAGAQAAQDLRGAFASFNQRYEGRALFGGDAVDQTPLADADNLLNDIRTLYAASPDIIAFDAALDSYFNDPAGGFMTNIYQGGDGDAPRAEVSEGEIVAYSAKVDEAPIRSLLRNLAVAAVAAESPTAPLREAALNESANGLLAAETDLVSIRARIGVAESTIQNSLDRLNAEETVLSASYNEMIGVDQFEVASRLQQLETQLQTSFILTARISQLSLANFI